MDGGKDRHVNFVMMGKPWDGSADEMTALREIAAAVGGVIGSVPPYQAHQLYGAWHRYQVAKAEHERVRIRDYTPHFRSKER